MNEWIGLGSLSIDGFASDIDNDGDLDIFIINDNDNDNDMFINNGNGVFTRRVSGEELRAYSDSDISDSEGTHARSVATTSIDADNDGDSDIVIVNRCGSSLSLSQCDGAVLLLNNGSGVFTKANNTGYLPLTRFGMYHYHYHYHYDYHY